MNKGQLTKILVVEDEGIVAAEQIRDRFHIPVVYLTARPLQNTAIRHSGLRAGRMLGDPESRKYLIILDSGWMFTRRMLGRNDIIAGFIQFCKGLTAS